MKKISLPKISFRDVMDIIIAKLKIIVILLSVLIITGFGFFLYRDFYLTIISAREIVVLESEVAATAINSDALESIEQKHKQKQSLPVRDWSNFRNIFYESTNTRPVTNSSNDNKDTTNPSVQPKTSF